MIWCAGRADVRSERVWAVIGDDCLDGDALKLLDSPSLLVQGVFPALISVTLVQQS